MPVEIFKRTMGVLLLCGLTACAAPIDFAVHDAAELPDVNSFEGIAARIAPVAQDTCEAFGQALDCRIQIFLASTETESSNAFQSFDNRGRPFVLITPELLSETENADEVALVLGHEAAHAIFGHLHMRRDITEKEERALAKELQAQDGKITSERQAQMVRLLFGDRSARRNAELEADALGALLAREAGYNATNGARFIRRLEDPGRHLFSTHPSNKERLAAISRGLRYGRLPATTP
ncbi:MAG: M48 family metalloprotease [Cognatishimia sp.]